MAEVASTPAPVDSILILGFGPAGQRVAEELLAEHRDRLVVLDLNIDNIALARLLRGDVNQSKEEETLEPISPRVRACCFWLLAASADSPHVNQAWFQPDGSALPVIGALRQLAKPSTQPPQPVPEPSPALETPPPASAHVIDHYLLLPLYEWGVVEWHLDLIRPYLFRHHPTLGFSHAEATLAKRVTILGGEQIFPEDEIDNFATPVAKSSGLLEMAQVLQHRWKSYRFHQNRENHDRDDIQHLQPIRA